jgi:translocation and assembly module TamB
LNLKARAFELEALAPLVASYVSGLEGQLDANLSAELDPDSPDIQGSAVLRDGVFQLPALGQRFSDVQAELSVRDNELRIDGLQARGITGKLTADARAKLSGTTLQSASVRMDIQEKEKLPITLEGVMIGDAFGHATLTYAHPNPDSPTEIKIDVPTWRLQMPDGAQNSVQDLDPAEDIRIGTRRSDGKFAAIPLQPFEAPSAEEAGKPPSLTRVRIHLGDSVWVHRGRQATVQLAGDLEIRAGAEQQVTGRIELRGGKLDVSGKQFEIERGVISFEGDDPGNPTVTATARWDSPAEYSVYAEYSGTVRDGKLKLRSEPALSQDEILSLLLFGTPGGGVGGGTENADPNATGTAVSVAGDTATRGLNRAISDVTSLDVSARIDTSTGSARPELVVQLTPRLTSRLTRAIGEPAPGESPDRTFITLELRLLRAWAISGVVGDHGGSALELIWRNRY